MHLSSKSRVLGALVGITATLVASSALAQQSPQQPKAAPAGAAPDAPDAPQRQTTLSVTLPDHRIELGARLGAIAGGEITPVGQNKGYTSASWLAIIDGDYIVHPFFTVGAFGHFTHASFEQRVNDAAVTQDGGLSIITFGASVKGRVPLSESLVGRAGLYAGRNFLSGSATNDGKKHDASGGGIDLGLTVELAYTVSQQVALTAQLGFVSQVAGSMQIDDGKDKDLAFTPKVFAALGPSVYF